jgi:hypothetical protein
MMTISRRDFLHTGLAIGASATMVRAAAPPLLGLIAPPANYPVPDEG